MAKELNHSDPGAEAATLAVPAVPETLATKLLKVAQCAPKCACCGCSPLKESVQKGRLRIGGNNDLAKVCMDLDGHITNAPTGLLELSTDTSNTVILDMCRTCVDGVQRMPEDLPFKHTEVDTQRRSIVLNMVANAARQHWAT